MFISLKSDRKRPRNRKWHVELAEMSISIKLLVHFSTVTVTYFWGRGWVPLIIFSKSGPLSLFMNNDKAYSY